MTTTLSNPADQVLRTRTVEVEFLYLDLTTCTRCVGSDENLRAALDMVRPVLAATGIELALRKTLVESEEQARALGFVSSPTIRVDGRDIAGELRESACADCGELCGCDEDTNCRVWLYQGQEYTQAPAGLIVESILSAAYVGMQALAPTAQPYEDVPDNLKRFYAGQGTGKQVELVAAACCAPAAQATCCAPAEKANCCGASSSTSCGCQ